MVEKLLTPPSSYAFLTGLHQVNLLLTPIARGLKTLEGQNTTCSDVFFVYVGIACGFRNVFRDAETAETLKDHIQETYDVFNRRFTILMTESTPDMFLLAYFLDPGQLLLLLHFAGPNNSFAL